VLTACLAYVTIIGRIIVTAGSVTLCIFWVRARPASAPALAHGALGPALFVAVGGLVITGLVLGLYAKTVHAVFQCACLDADAGAPAAVLRTRFRAAKAAAAPEAVERLVRGPDGGAAARAVAPRYVELYPAQAHGDASELAGDRNAPSAPPPPRGYAHGDASGRACVDAALESHRRGDDQVHSSMETGGDHATVTATASTRRGLRRAGSGAAAAACAAEARV